MHPGNSGLSGGAFTFTTNTRAGEKGKKERRKKKKKKKGKGRKKRTSCPLIIFYIDSLCIRECNARLCAMPFIIYTWITLALINLFLYIPHTLGLINKFDDQTLPIYIVVTWIFWLRRSQAYHWLLIPFEKSCLPLEVRCTNKPAIAPPELETRR